MARWRRSVVCRFELRSPKAVVQIGMRIWPKRDACGTRRRQQQRDQLGRALEQPTGSAECFSFFTDPRASLVVSWKTLGCRWGSQKKIGMAEISAFEQQWLV